MAKPREAKPIAMALLAVVVLFVLRASAVAEPIVLGPGTIQLEGAWTGEAPVTTGSPLLARRQGDVVLTVTRIAAPNPAAWRSATREAYIADVEAGVVSSAGAGATKLASKRKKLGADGVNVLDVTVRRTGPKGPEVVAVRILLFRTLTMAAAAARTDTRAGRKQVEAAVAGLAPSK